MNTVQATGSNTLSTGQRIRAIAGVCAGALVEWFDFFIYAYTSIYFASLFFPTGDPVSQLLATAAVFAVGFFMRPLGGWIFGYIADTKGRKLSMMISVLVMCAGSLLVAVLPTYETIGVAAPILLVVARLMQGLSVGAEYGTGATYLSEVSTKGRRSLFASCQFLTIMGGQLMALVTVALIQYFLPQDMLKEWGWRIPFFMGAAAALVVLYLRRSMVETATEESMTHKEAGSIKALGHYKRSVVLTFAITIGISLYYYTFTAYMQKLLVVSAGFAPATVSTIMICALIVFMIMQPFFGMLADRIGVKKSMMIFGSIGVVTVAPILSALSHAQSALEAFVLIVLGFVIGSFYTPVVGLLKADLYPASVRALGVGLPYAIGAALFGGSSEYVALSFRLAGVEHYFFYYVTAVVGVTAIAAYLMPDLRKYGYLDGVGDVEHNIGLKNVLGQKKQVLQSQASQ